MATPSAIRLNFSVLIPLDSCHTLAPHRMIDFDQHRMLSPLSISSSDVLINDSKFPSSSHLYLRQQHTVQIIQLVEGPPPSPRHIGSVINGSAASSSDCSTNDSTEDSESSDDDDDEESVCSSYCSSDAPPEHPESPRDDESTRLISGSPSQTYSLPWKRILDWRQNFSAPLSATLSGHSLKRKIQIDGDDDRDDDDSTSHSSKRSRSQSRSHTSLGEGSVVSIDMHSCPACDLSFPTPQSLRQHGRDAEATNEACSVAVEYAFE